jgi:hypothetical protein
MLLRYLALKVLEYMLFRYLVLKVLEYMLFIATYTHLNATGQHLHPLLSPGDLPPSD